MSARRFCIDHLTVAELQQLLEDVEKRLALLNAGRESVAWSPSVGAESNCSFTSEEQRGVRQGPISVAQRVHESNWCGDPWEGTGSLPLQWEYPFYSGRIVYPRYHAPQRDLFVHSVQGHHLPEFGGSPCVSAHIAPETGRNIAQEACEGVCVICYSPCILGGQSHGMHLCQRHRTG